MYKCNIFPDKEKAKELLRAEIGRQYCNKFFYLESSLKEKEPEERKQQRAVFVKFPTKREKTLKYAL